MTRKLAYGSVEDYRDFCAQTGRDPKDMASVNDYDEANHGIDDEARESIERFLTAKKHADKTASYVASKYSNRLAKTASTWQYDGKLAAYVSSTPSHLACACGSELPVPGYTNCKCGKVWNAYKISSGKKEAFAPVYVAREVCNRNDLVLASRTASRNDFGKKYLEPEGWRSWDTGQTMWESPDGLKAYDGSEDKFFDWGNFEYDEGTDVSSMANEDLFVFLTGGDSDKYGW